MENAVDLIRIVCVKLGKLDMLPRWRIVKRRKLIKEIDIIFNEFFSMDIFEQANALSAIILRFYKKSPDIINNAFNDIRITEVSLEMKLSKYIDEVSHNGIIAYIPSKHTFEIDMIANSNESDGYKFSYSDNNSLPRQLKSIWINELSPAIGYKFYDAIIVIADIINHANYYSSIEFVND